MVEYSDSGRVDRVLIGTKNVIPTTLDPYTITSRSLFGRLPTRWLLDFLVDRTYTVI